MPKMIRVEVGVSQDPRESALSQFLVKRHHKGQPTTGLLEANVTTALANHDQPSFSSALTSSVPETTGCRGLTPAE
jgi:hypothetical protein